MVAFSTLATLLTSAIAFSAVDALPAKSFPRRLPLTDNIKSEISKRAVAIKSLPLATGNAVPLRRDFEVFSQDEPALTLFILALQKMQQTAQSDPTSFYQVAGIHGRPYQPWDNIDGGNNQGGYCTHADILFLSWHRPYLALYENTLYNHVQDIANAYPAGSADSTKYKAAAATWRMPYWDWAAKPTINPIIGSQAQIQVNDPAKGTITIDNPLFSFKYNFANANTQRAAFPDAPFSTAKNTQRIGFNDLNNQLANIGDNLRTRIYNLLTAYTDYASFSNKGTTTAVDGNLDSLESVHDVIHATVGGGQFEMGFIDYAAMDPLFFLHHTNIDRIFAIWQAIHANSYVPNQFTNNYGTWAIKAGTRETSQTGLAPFRGSNGQFFTSDDVRSTTSFGYVYAENDPTGKPADNFQAWVISTVNTLYGKKSPAGVLTSVSSATKQMSTSTSKPATTSQPAAPTTNAAQPTTPAKPVTSATQPTTSAVAQPVTTPNLPSTKPSPVQPAPAPSQTASTPQRCDPALWWEWLWIGQADCFWKAAKHEFGNRKVKRDFEDDVDEITGDIKDITGEIISAAIDALPSVAELVNYAEKLIYGGDMYSEYIAQIRTANNALNGTYSVFLFLGDHSSDPKSWSTEANLIGTHSVFTMIGGGHYFTSGGSVPLTSTLIGQVAKGNLESLSSDDVVPFLAKNLNWEIATASGQSVSAADANELKIAVYESPVKLPCVAGALPYWNTPTIQPGATEGKPGGYCTGESM